jgi:hypothetical protein
MKLKHILILQNKIDLIKDSQARDQHEQVKLISIFSVIKTLFQRFSTQVFGYTRRSLGVNVHD